MSDLLFLSNDKRCPRCGKLSARLDFRKCASCRAILLKPNDTFRQLYEDGLRSFYVFFPPSGESFRGWVHSGHLENPEPLQRDWVPEKPDDNYGKDMDMSDRALKVST